MTLAARTRSVITAMGQPRTRSREPQPNRHRRNTQWKLSFATLERALFDVNDDGALFIEAQAENGIHMIPWNQVLRLTIHQGHSF